MSPFDFARATEAQDALSLYRAHLPHRPAFLAGGTNLIDLLKEGVTTPGALVDITRLPLRDIALRPDGALSLGALASNAETANHPLVVEHAPLLRSAILAGASPQIRNRATNGGNLLQRTRCVYFYDRGVPCNKREPGTGCPATVGIARQHAILGASSYCIATHPSDMCVALAALGAEVHVTSDEGDRVIPFLDFHRLPGMQPEVDSNLQPGELITQIVIPANQLTRHHAYLKVRERASYAFALVSVAAALALRDGVVVEARVALGGVAHKPWRDLDAERLLLGKRPEVEAFEELAASILKEARPWGGPPVPESLPGNEFKIPLARRAIVRALEMARDGVTTNTGEDAFRRLGEPTAPEATA